MKLPVALFKPKQPDKIYNFSNREKLFLGITFVLFALLFIPAMGRSLWIDETITYWVVKDGFWDLIYRAIHYQGQSPFYYLIVWCFIQILGHAEWVLRLPSLISLMIACVIMYKLGLFFFNREGGLIAALSFINLWALIGQFIGGSCSARPYELAVMLSALSILCFVLWIKTGRKGHQITYIIASAATCYAHILFAPVLFIHFCYFFISRGKKIKVSFRKLLLTFGKIVVCILPNIYQLMLLNQKKELLSLSTMPSVINLVHAWFPRVLFVPLIAGYLITLILERKVYWGKGKFSSKPFLFFLIWYFFPALFWFVSSILSGTSIFLLRYYCWSFSVIALIIASFTIAMESESARAISVLTLSMLLTFTFIFSPTKPLENWRAATDYINSININNKWPIFVWPGLMEQRDWGWSQKPDNEKYLLAPFSFYHLQKKAILLPLIPDKLKLEELLSQHDISTKSKEDEIYLILRNTHVKERGMPKAITGQNIIKNWLNLNGYLVVQKKMFGGVVVSRFTFSSDKRID